MKMVGILARLLTVLLLVMGTIATLGTSAKVISTGVNLMVLHDNASYYNEQHRKTDEMTEMYNRNQEEREKFYKSEDPVIRGYSNLGTLTKLLCLFLAVAMWPGVVLVWLYVLLNIYWRLERKLKRRKRKSSSSRKNYA